MAVCQVLNVVLVAIAPMVDYSRYVRYLQTRNKLKSTKVTKTNCCLTWSHYRTVCVAVSNVVDVQTHNVDIPKRRSTL